MERERERSPSAGEKEINQSFNLFQSQQQRHTSKVRRKESFLARARSYIVEGISFPTNSV